MKEQSIPLSPFIKYLYMISGFILVAIGVIGIFLFLLPTTIFLILTSICFVKSSPRANSWLRDHRYLGGYIDNYQHFYLRKKLILK
ncbi:MAG: YbaN family protein [Ignavibacteriota bacterium]